MKQFMFLFKGGDAVWDSKTPQEQEAHMQKWQEWIGGLVQQEKFLGGERLYPQGATVHSGSKNITDRPLSEAKELVGGYVVVKADSLAEATEMAKACPGLDWDSSVEVREVWPEN